MSIAYHHFLLRFYFLYMFTLCVKIELITARPSASNLFIAITQLIRIYQVHRTM